MVRNTENLYSMLFLKCGHFGAVIMKKDKRNPLTPFAWKILMGIAWVIIGLAIWGAFYVMIAEYQYGMIK